MSYVTTVMIQFDSIGDEDRDKDIPEIPSDFKNTAKVQEIAKRLCEGQIFKKLKGWGGDCAPQVDDVYGAGFNYFPVDEFVAEVEKLSWENPAEFRLFIRDEDSVAFGVWVFVDGKLEEVVEQERD
jgi:hypothetical protein